MYWVYILKSLKNNSLYIGKTDNLGRRIKEHNLGLSFATKRYRPWAYAYVEGYASRDDAEYRENSIKYYGKVYAQLKRRIAKSLNT